MSAWFLRKYLNDEDLAAISTAVGEAEKNTVGEICVCIRHRRHWRERKMSLHELTVAEFSRLHMEKTRSRAGVLILLLFSEKQFHIVGDLGIHNKVGDQTWVHVANKMGAHFKAGHFRDGIIEGVMIVGKELEEYFPKTADDVNELGNDVVVKR